jgi:hypothetical protein
MRETIPAEFPVPRFAQERGRFINGYEQIRRCVNLRGRLVDGIREQPRMTPAGNRILRSLCRRVVPVTRRGFD